MGSLGIYGLSYSAKGKIMIRKIYVHLRVKWILFTIPRSEGYIKACRFYRAFTGKGLQETVEAVKSIRGPV